MPSPLPDEEILNALRTAAPTPPQNLLERWQPQPYAPPTPLRSQRPWIMGLTAATVCAAALALLPGSPLRPTPTFADVERVMTEVKTISWKETWMVSHAYYPDGRVKTFPASQPRQHWASMEIPAIARKGRKLSHRISRDGKTFQISEFQPGLRSYQVYSWSLVDPELEVFGKSAPKNFRERLTAQMLFPPISESDSWQSTREMVKGHQTLRLRRSSRSQSNIKGWHQEGITWTFWINPETRRVLRSEIRYHNRRGAQTVDDIRVCDEFRYNETPPAGVFDATPKVGTRYVYIPQPNRKIKPEDQKAMTALVRKAADAWNAGDEATYLSLWRFNHPTNGSSREEQQAAIRKSNRYRWSDKYLGHRSQVRISGVYTHRQGDIFPPTDPVEFEYGLWGLLKEPDGFKIVRVHIPPTMRKH